jgi:hypothetical protein
MTLEQLLSEPVAAARRREQAALGLGANDQLVLFGAGQLGRKVLAGLRRHGIQPAAFLDNNPALQGIQIGGLPVYSPAAGAQRFGAGAVFLVTIFRGLGDAGMAARERSLKALGCRRVLTFLPAAWKYPGGLLPHLGATRNPARSFAPSCSGACGATSRR